jgi:hypothetical protein
MSNGVTQEMSREQFAWGLSNGITVLAISGVFWLSLGVCVGNRRHDEGSSDGGPKR